MPVFLTRDPPRKNGTYELTIPTFILYIVSNCPDTILHMSQEPLS